MKEKNVFVVTECIYEQNMKPWEWTNIKRILAGLGEALKKRLQPASPSPPLGFSFPIPIRPQ